MTPYDAFEALQKAVVSRLKLHPQTARFAVYDSVPLGAAFPYVAVGLRTAEPLYHDGDGTSPTGFIVNATLRLDAWDRAPRGQATSARVMGIMRAAGEALASAPLAVEGFRLVMDEAEMSQVIAGGDEAYETRQGMLSFRFYLEHAN